MKAVDILVRRDRIDNGSLVDLVWQRQLHQNAVNGIIRVQCVDQRQQFILAGGDSQAMFDRAHTGGGGAFDLVAHIDSAGRVLAYQNHGKRRRAANFLGQLPGLNGDAINQLF